MAFGGGGAGRVKSDINVTPLVDVVLVLLIIFLVAMPVEMRDITMEIPKKSEDTTPPDPTAQQLVVTMGPGGTIKINDTEVARADLAARLRERLERMRDKVVFVDFDPETRYGEAVSVMDTCRGAGASKVALKMKEEGGTETPGAPAPGPAPPPGAPPPSQ